MDLPGSQKVEILFFVYFFCVILLEKRSQTSGNLTFITSKTTQISPSAVKWCRGERNKRKTRNQKRGCGSCSCFSCSLISPRWFGTILWGRLIQFLCFPDTHPRGRMASTFSRLLTGRNASLLFATLGTSALTTGYLLKQQNVRADIRDQHKLFPAR